MEELSFKTKVFEGPLDLMLSLIAKHKLNIMDIEISVLLEQFLLYIEQMQSADMEIAGEFMEMAARLIYIKSASLLPKHEVEEMKKELSGALVEYALCKQAALKLSEIFIGGSVFVRKPQKIVAEGMYRVKHDPIELLESIRSIFGKVKFPKQVFAPVKPVVAQKFVTVFTKIVYVLRKIQYGGKMELIELYKGQKRSEQVAIFLALLELSKYGRVSFSEDGKYIIFNNKPLNHDNDNNAESGNGNDNEENEIVDEDEVNEKLLKQGIENEIKTGGANLQ